MIFTMEMTQLKLT